MQNWSQTLLSRFADKPIIISLISSFNAAMDQTANLDAFLQYIWDVRTAVGNGLNIWGKIVNVSRVIPSAPASLPPITLDDTDYQTLILVKAAANIGNVTVPTLNKLLQQIFAGSGLVFVQDNLNMTLTYVFLFNPSIEQLAIIENSGAMPRPAGVLVDYAYATVIGPLNTAPLNTIPLNYLSITQV